MKTIFQTESHEEQIKGRVKILSDGAVIDVCRLGTGLNMKQALNAEKNTSVLIEIEDAQTGKVSHTFLITSMAD